MNANDPDTEAHDRFLETAAGLARPLADALERIGPVALPDRGDVPLATFLARAVVGQQLSTTAARTIWGRLEAAASDAGRTLPGYAADAGAEALRACGLSRGKARALAHIAAAEAEGRLEGERFRDLDHAAISAELGALWGVGQWTCDMAAIFWCRCPDVWPAGDVAVQRTFRGLIGRRRKPERAAARFAPERSRLAVYMWRVADAVPD